MRVRADRDRGAVLGRPAGVDPVRRYEQIRVDAQVGSRIAERPATGIARDDGALDLRRPPEQPRRALDFARCEQLPDRRRRHTGHEPDPLDGKPQLLEGRQVAAAPPPEAEVRARDH